MVTEKRISRMKRTFFIDNVRNYKFSGVPPKCLFSGNVISGSNAVTRLRSRRYPSLSCHYKYGLHSRNVTCDSDPDKSTSMLILSFKTYIFVMYILCRG